METLELEDHRHILVLSQKLLNCETVNELTSTAVVGVGSLIESVSCAWTELMVPSYQEAQRSVTIADSDTPLDLERIIPVFDELAIQHPVINSLLETRSTRPLAISDLLSDAEFRQLDLYRRFYAEMGIVDQLSVGRIIGDRVAGCSVNRSSRGFTMRERAVLNALGDIIFPVLRLLRTAQPTDNADNADDPSPSADDLVTVVGDPNFLRRTTSLGLSEREAEVLALIASGKSNKQIAVACELSPGTVRKHTENIYRQLGVNNRVSATLVALDRLR